MTNDSKLSLFITKLVLVSFLTQALLPVAYAADLIIDTSGGAAKTPLLDATQNGVPIVHITRPSAGGVSHNLYQQFNVGNQGVILNNAVTSVQTELGGTIGRNLLMGTTPARIILNEVTRGGASLLQGKTEIAGSQAEFILANPNGISCNGCGFINTSRANLVTGVPIFNGANLSGFNISSGQIDIGIGGLNALNMAELDLISRSLSINGAVYAQNAYVVTGLNTVDYASLDATPFSNATTKPTVAVDIAQLGGMYANQIYLLATEQGVGVNNRGRLEAQGGGLSLDVNGTLTNSGLLKSGNGLASANGTIIASAINIENNLGTVQGDGLVLMQATANLNNIAASIQGEQVRLSAGATLTSESGIIGASKDVVLSAVGDLNIVAGAVQAGENISLLSGKDLDISPLVNTNSNTIYGTRTQYVVNTAGGWVSQMAGMAGYQTVCGKSNVGMGMGSIIYGGALGGVSGGCTGPQTVPVQVRDGSSVTTTTIQNNGSLIEAVGNIDLQANKGSISLDALSMTAGDSITAQARAIALFGSKDAKTRSSYTPIKGGFVSTSNLDETLVYGGLNAGWDISLLATGDSTVTGEAAEHEGKIFVTGSRINADKGHLSLLGSGDIDIAHDVTRHQSYYEYYKKKKSFFKKKTTHIINSTELGQIEPSIISANSISIGADRDLNIVASDIIADNAIGLYAGQDLNILSTGEIYHSYNYRKVKKSGIFSSGGFGVTIGSQSKTERTTTDNLTQITSSVSSLNGDIYATAGNQYLQLSSELLTPQGSINIAAKEVAIHSNNNTQSVLQSIQTKQTGLTIGVSSPLLTAGQTIASVAEASRRTSDSRMQALGMLTAGLTVYNNFDAINKFAKNPTSLDALGGASVGVSFGTSKTSFESLTKTSLPQESILTAGRDINITATGDKADEQGDISLIGTMANAGGNVRVIAANDINLAAAIGTTTEATKKKSSSASIGINIDVATKGVTATLGVSNSRGFSNGWGTTYFPTELTAKQALTIESGRHTTLKGATVSGDKVTANIGKNFAQTGETGNLTISSPQDASHYIAKESSSGFNISIPIPIGGVVTGAPSVGLNASQLKLLSDYQSAKQQTAIRAGAGGYDIKVNGHTQLNGGAIASTADATKNSLATQTLDFTNLVNRENTSGTSTAISLNLSGTAESIYAGSGVGTANINQSSYGHTLAAIAPANVLITRPDLQLANDKKYADVTRAPLVAVLTVTNNSLATAKAQQSAYQQQIARLQASEKVEDYYAQRIPLQATLTQTNANVVNAKSQQTSLQQQLATLQASNNNGNVVYWQNQVASLQAQVSAAAPKPSTTTSCSMAGCTTNTMASFGASGGMAGIAGIVAQNNYNNLVAQLNAAKVNVVNAQATLAAVPSQINTVNNQLSTVNTLVTNLSAAQTAQQNAINILDQLGAAAIQASPNSRGNLNYWQNQVNTLQAQVNAAATASTAQNCNFIGCTQTTATGFMGSSANVGGITGIIAQNNYNSLSAQLNTATANLNAEKNALATIPQQISNVSTQLNAVNTQVNSLAATQGTQQAAVNAIVDSGATLKVISRDPNTAHKPVTSVFDKTKATKELQAGVAITMAFGQAAYKTAGGIAKTKTDSYVSKTSKSQAAEAQRLNSQAEADAAKAKGDTQLAAIKQQEVTKFTQDRDTANASITVQDKADYEAWKEGGIAKTALHAIIGGLSFGVNGVVAATANQLAQPVIDKVITNASITDTALINTIKFAAGTAIGAGVGGAQGAATTLTADANNRQLHENEAKKLAELKKGKDEAAKERLDDAACYKVHCAAGVPDSDPFKADLIKQETRGATYTSELALLTGTGLFYYADGSNGQYAKDFINDTLLSHDEFITRAGGSVKLGSGAFGVVVGGTVLSGGVVTCPATALSCLLVPVGGTIAVMSYSQAREGTYELLGQYQSTIGQRVLDSFDIKTYPGDSNRAVELGLSAAEAAAYTALFQFGGKYVIQGGKLIVQKAQTARGAIKEAIEGMGTGKSTSKEVAVLGKYPDYINLASHIDAKRFNIPTEIWNKMSPTQQWEANVKFLDRAIVRGDEFILANRVFDINTVNGSYRKELDYLITKGYKISKTGLEVVK